MTHSDGPSRAQLKAQEDSSNAKMAGIEERLRRDEETKAAKVFWEKLRTEMLNRRIKQSNDPIYKNNQKNK